MKTVIHRVLKSNVTPMVILGDYQEVLRHLSDTNAKLKKENPSLSDFSVIKFDLCELDPGGMKVLNLPYSTFQIDGFNFSVQHTTIFDVLQYFKIAADPDRIPGYVRVPMQYQFIILPETTYEALILKLEELLMSDDELHASITRHEIIKALETTGGFLDLRTPKED